MKVEDYTLTAAQIDALEVLAAAGGERVGASKRRSRPRPDSNVNIRAADALVRMGLARNYLRDLHAPAALMVAAYDYTATQEGQRVMVLIRARRAASRGEGG